ncbi:hypothetical protein BJV77DRAFT_963129 [Russula vinacea]|nr:hypothetical protein BJV77DRAFT_963129 [Russula vinacea]
MFARRKLEWRWAEQDGTYEVNKTNSDAGSMTWRERRHMWRVCPRPFLGYRPYPIEITMSKFSPDNGFRMNDLASKQRSGGRRGCEFGFTTEGRGDARTLTRLVQIKGENRRRKEKGALGKHTQKKTKERTDSTHVAQRSPMADQPGHPVTHSPANGIEVLPS